MYYSLVGGSRIRVSVVRPVPQHRHSGLEPACGGSFRAIQAAPTCSGGTRFAEAVPSCLREGDGLPCRGNAEEVAVVTTQARPVRAVLVLGRPAVSSVIVAARTLAQLEITSVR